MLRRKLEEFNDVAEDDEILRKRLGELNELCESFGEDEIEGLSLSINSVSSTTN